METSNRRDFLRHSALMGVAAILPSALLAGGGSKPPKNRLESAKPQTPPTGDTYTVSLKSLRPQAIKPRKINIPDVEGFKVLKGDFHIHTLFSDGSVMPHDRVNEAVQNGLDVISITDHIEYRPYFSKVGKWKLTDAQADNYNLWYEEALPEAEKRGLLLVRGTEITKRTMPPGHFNALFADDNNPIAAAVDDWRTMLQVAADHGAFLLWNHPGWEAPGSGGIEPGAPLRFTDAHEEVRKKGLLHGVEIFNGGQYYPVVSDWCNERELAIFANSDIHSSELNMYGLQNPLRPMTLVLAKERTLDSIREAFFARRTIGWAADMVWGSSQWLTSLFKAAVGIKTINPGTLELTNNSSLPIMLSIGGAVRELPEHKPLQFYKAAGTNKFTVNNWMVGLNKPLEVDCL